MIKRKRCKFCNKRIGIFQTHIISTDLNGDLIGLYHDKCYDHVISKHRREFRKLLKRCKV